MTFHLYLFSLLLLATCCSLYISFLAWRRRRFPIAISLCLGMLSGAFYSFGYAFEIASTSLEQIQFWLRIQYIGISFGTFIWFIMVLQYTDFQVFFRKQHYILMVVVPIITFITHNTNQWHFLFYKDIMIDTTSDFLLAAIVPGPYYILHVLYSYLLFIIGMVLLYCMYRKATLHMKKQIALVMIGSVAPYGITLVYLSGVLPTSYDISPFSFLLSGIFFMWGIYQFNMMKLSPLAFEKAFESMEDAVILLDLDNSLIHFNQSAKKSFPDLDDIKAIGKDADSIFSEYPKLLSIINQIPTIETKVSLGNHSNSTYYNIQVTYVSSKRLKPVAKMLMLSDVTKSVNAEEILRSNAKQLKELNMFKDKMFTVVAHDIRDPLAILMNLMELLKDEVKLCEEDHSEITMEMDKQIQRTFNLVESLLNWYRNQSGRILFNPMTWNLQQIVQTNIQFLEIQRDVKSIEISTDISNDLYVQADKQMLDLIFRNILTNSIKYSGNGGEIIVKARQVEEKIIISIEDMGIGIHQDQAKRLLKEEYPDSVNGTGGEEGSGIGLTLCKEFIRVNGGDIWFTSIAGQGSTFYFSIPSAERAVTHLTNHREGEVPDESYNY